MKIVIVLALVTLLSGCATAVEIMGAYYDAQDPCQQVENTPDFCGYSDRNSLMRSTTYFQRYPY